MAKSTSNSIQLVREAAEADLWTFIRLVAPHRVFGAVHEEVCRWWTREDAKDNQLLLLPRDHQKSALIAYRVAWWITRNPETTILYISATADLAEKQTKFIKDIITCDQYRLYWPEMVLPNEFDRELWRVDAFSVDHPRRKAEMVRDPTVQAVGLTANTTGKHCNVAVLDDVVVPNNAYTDKGRSDVQAFYSQLASIQTTGAKEWCVGTRYHPADLYKDLMDMVETDWVENEEGIEEEIESPVYETFERVVETDGEFLWPKQRRSDGKVFGFDAKELARKKAKYLDIRQFYSQYYNRPNAVNDSGIGSDKFQYYERSALVNVGSKWYIHDRELSVFSAIDFAFSEEAAADYTAIVVVGVDSEGYYYVLDISRFKTKKISVMTENVINKYNKWRWRKMRVEVTVAQSAVCEQLKDNLRREGIFFSFDEIRPNKTSKEERMAAILEPRYAQGVIWHYKGGNCQILEDELSVEMPEHDDVKDAFANAIDLAVVPNKKKQRTGLAVNDGNVVFHSRFGGVSR